MAIQISEIGMGWYQWQLFFVIGFGWASDNFWPVITSLIFTVSPFARSPLAFSRTLDGETPL